jgi:hypothetical protein
MQVPDLDLSHMVNIDISQLITPAQALNRAPTKLRVVQLFLSGKNLKNLDKGRDKSDTFVVLKMKWSGDQKDWIEVDQTETCFNNL